MRLTQVQEITSIVTIVGNLTLIIMYGVTLQHMRQGTKYQLFMILIKLLMAACAFAALLAFTNFEVVKYGAGEGSDENVLAWVSVNSIAYLGYGACFNSAHWLFAYEYFVIAEIMPLVMKQHRVPSSKQRCYLRLKWTLLVLNIAAPIVAGVFLFIDNFFYYTKRHSQSPFAWAYTYSMTVNAAFQIISGLFILYAVYQIGHTMRNKGLKAKDVDTRNLALHAAAFVIYMLALIVDVVFFFNYMVNATKNKKDAFRSFIIVQIIGNVFNYLG